MGSGRKAGQRRDMKKKVGLQSSVEVMRGDRRELEQGTQGTTRTPSRTRKLALFYVLVGAILTFAKTAQARDVICPVEADPCHNLMWVISLASFFSLAVSSSILSRIDTP